MYDCEGALNLTADVMTISGTFTELNLEGVVIEISNISVVNGSLSILGIISLIYSFIKSDNIRKRGCGWQCCSILKYNVQQQRGTQFDVLLRDGDG